MATITIALKTQNIVESKQTAQWYVENVHKLKLKVEFSK